MNSPSPKIDPLLIGQAHELYCQLTGQQLSLRFDRQRLWYELLRCGFTLRQVRRVIRYLQGEILAGRRNVGALKLSNLLQPDRFEEDLAISAVRLEPPRPPPPPAQTMVDTQMREQARQRALQQIRQLKATLE